MSCLFRVWEGYNYRTASGTIRIKDPGLPITIGFNIRFNISGTVFVAQIESLDTSFSIDPKGNKSTITTIHFSRLMQEDEDDSHALVFCPAERFADLWGDAKFVSI